MILFALLCFRYNIRLSNQYASTLPTFFHFFKNGNFTMISTRKDNAINYIICNQKEYQIFQEDPDHSGSYCYDSGFSIDDFQEGEVDKKGAYQFIFYQKSDLKYSQRSRPLFFYNFTKKSTVYPPTAVQSNDTEEKRSEVLLILRNPYSYLDSNVYFCLITKPIFAILSGLIFLFWIVNWFTNFSKSITIHEFITFQIILSLLYFIIQSCELGKRNKSDFFTALTPFRIVFLFLSQFILFTTILIIAKGWFVVYQSIGFKTICMSFLLSFLLVSPQIFFITNFVNKSMGSSLIILTPGSHCYSDGFQSPNPNSLSRRLNNLDTTNCYDFNFYTNKTWVNFVMIGLELIGSILFYIDLIISIDESSTYIIAHLIVISESGIDPKTTPIYKKYVIYKLLSWGILIFLFFQMLIILITQFFEDDVPFYIQQLLFDLTNIFALIGMVIILRLNKKNSRGFMRLPYSTDQDISLLIDDTTIDQIDLNNVKNRNYQQPSFDNVLLDTVDLSREIEGETPESNKTNNKLARRVVSREEVWKFETKKLGHKENENDGSDKLMVNLQNDRNVNDNVVESTNVQNNRKVKWEEWMTLPPQPLLTGETKSRRRKKIKTTENEEHQISSGNDIDNEIDAHKINV